MIDFAKLLLVAMFVSGFALNMVTPGRNFGSVSTAAAEATDVGDAAMFRGNPARTGEMDGPGPSSTPAILWSVPTESMVGSPAVANGTVFAISRDGFLHAIDTDSGRERWRFPMALSNLELQASPTVADGIVYAPSNLSLLYAIDMASGEERWHLEFPDNTFSVNSSPVVVDGVVYVVTGSGLHALDGATGSQIWHFETSSSVYSSPAIAGDTVYFGGGWGAMYAIDIATGDPRWQAVPQPSQQEPGVLFSAGGIHATPAVANGMVYGGSQNGLIFALDATSGQTVWTSLAEEGVESSPAVAHGTVYIGSFDGHLYALDATSGTKLWQFATGEPVESSPVVAAGAVYVAVGDSDAHRGTLFAIDAASGAELWRVALFDPVGESSPVIVDRIVYIGSDFGGSSGGLYAIGEPSGVRANPCESAMEDPVQSAAVAGTPGSLPDFTSDVPMFQGNPARTGEVPGSGPDNPPSTLWRFARGTGAAVVDGIAYVDTDTGISAIDAATGVERWQVAIEEETSSTPTVINGIVYVASGDQSFGEMGALIALDAGTGDERWRANLPIPIGASSPVVVDDVVYVGGGKRGEAGVLFALDSASGQQLWRLETAFDLGNPAVADGIVYIDTLYHVIAVAAKTGEQCWRFPVGFRAGPPTVADGVLYVSGIADKSHVYAVDARTGTELWSVTNEDSSVWYVAAAGGVVYFGDDEAVLHAIDASSGRERWKLPTDGDLAITPPAVANGTVYLSSTTFNFESDEPDTCSLHAVDAGTGQERWHVEVGDGNAGAPVVANRMVYMGCEDGGFYAIGDT